MKLKHVEFRIFIAMVGSGFPLLLALFRGDPWISAIAAALLLAPICYLGTAFALRRQGIAFDATYMAQ
jgi:hypothetical protein